MELPEQYALSPPLTGADIIGQLQSGAVIDILFVQLLASVTIIVMFVTFGTPVMLQTLPPRFVTVPEPHVTVPELTVTPAEYVNRSAEQVAGVVIVIVGNGLTVISTLFDLLHPVAVMVSTKV